MHHYINATLRVTRTDRDGIIMGGYFLIKDGLDEDKEDIRYALERHIFNNLEFRPGCSVSIEIPLLYSVCKQNYLCTVTIR